MAKKINTKPVAVKKKRLSQTGTLIASGVISTDEYVNDLIAKKGVETYDKMMRSSATVRQTVDLVQLPVRAAKYWVQRVSEDARDVEVADFVESNLMGGMNMSWDATLETVLDMLPFGFSLLEKVYVPIDWNGQQKYAINLYPILQKSVQRWVIDDKGTYGVDQLTDGGFSCKIPMKDLLRFTYRQKGDNFEGQSILRAAYPHWYHINTYYKFSGMAYERAAMGIPVVTIPPNAKASQKLSAEKIAKNIRANNQLYASMPEGFKLEILDMKANTTMDPMPLIEHHSIQIARAALTAFMHLGTTPNGSRALSLDQSTIFERAEEAIARQIVDTINQDLIQELVDINFPDVKEYPKLWYSDISRDDVEELSTTLQRLYQSGAITTDPETENYVRKRIGFPMKTTATENPLRPNEYQTPDNTNAKNSAGRKKKIITAASDRATGGDWFRVLTASEKKVNFKGVQQQIDRGEEIIKDRLGNLSKQQLDTTLDNIRAAINTGNGLAAMQQVGAVLTEQYGEALFSEMRALFEYAKVTSADEMESVLGKGKVNAPATTAEEVAKLRFKAVAAAKDASEKVVNESVGLASELYIAERNTDDIINIVRDTVEKKIEKRVDSTAAISVIGSINQGRTFTQQENDDKIWGYQYSAILDNDTCTTCEGLDEKVVDKKDPAYLRLMPPQHFNCRCIWVEILQGEQDKPPVTGIPEVINQDLSPSNFKQISDKALKTATEE